MKDVGQYLLDFEEIDKAKILMVGGKAANLGELLKIDGIRVPEGFCVTTAAYERITKDNQQLEELLDQLKEIKAEERERISQITARIRSIIEATPIPAAIEEEIVSRFMKFKENGAFAVRSSATAEDLPTASFAGQQDTYLNIIGKKSILGHISKCWASLFTDRAVVYRIQNGFSHRHVRLSVIIQKMIFPQASGILFTADPISGNRKILSIDAGFGLGEALVSGLVSADNYKVKDNQVISKNVATKKKAIYALKEGGTKAQPLNPDRQAAPVLTDRQILHLEDLGRTIETYFGTPQDIEWCLQDDIFYIVQSRPITTLYPIPKVNDQKNHVYVSVGHQQMMTDAMKPLGLSIWQLTSARAMYAAGGRLFVDIAEELASPAKRHVIVNVLGKSDPLIRGALLAILERGNFIQSSPDDDKTGPNPLPDYQTLTDFDTAVVEELIADSRASIEKLKKSISTKSGTELFESILQDMDDRKKNLSDPRSFSVIMTGMNAASWINEKMKEWLGEKSVADTLSQSVPNNITSEMGLALLDVADAIRPYPEIVAYLQNAGDGNFLNELYKFNGGDKVHAAVNDFLNRYGMRCVGEIDITRTRWAEKPGTLVPLILSNIKNFEAGAGKRKFKRGLNEALNKEKELLDRLKQLPGGEQQARETKRMIDLVRNLAGYREYPKYNIITRYFIYKQALLKEAERLVQANVIREKEDIFYLRFEELRNIVQTHQVDYQLISNRKDQFRLFKKLTPPRVMTSDGEIITGRYIREHLPADAIVGLAVSSGVVEGRARVILNMEDADLEEGDILVTPFTDPSWTPVFVSIKGLVTEVGGLMTHGAVIAREYGLPAVVGMDNATNLIKDGQRIRLNGTDGYVEIL
jgi:pyruvate,water dikinase